MTPQPGTTGLTLGKFAPLHRGHQYLIETALAEVEQLIIVIYDCPDTTDLPLPVRVGWLRDIYPQATVVEAWDGPLEVGNTPAIRKRHEDYFINRLKMRGITHFYSSEFYGEHMSAALGAVNRLVDEARTRVPISATQVRQAPFAHRHFVHPRVYRDLITNVVFLGAPSTGKTTLAEHLAAAYQTVWMPEYGREYWEQHQVNRRLTPGQLVELAEVHLEREERLLSAANGYLFTDTNAITTWMFSHAYHGMAEARLTELVQLAATRYDLVFVCDTDIPYDDTWDRSGEVERLVFQKQILADLRMRRIPFFVLQGSVAERTATVQAILSRFHRYQTVVELLMGTTPA
ncbi:MAG: AAA family ATPase [Chloroflexaceae bacterium]|nr:AAA family ATPase [Chloroflexaceae bacterium]